MDGALHPDDLGDARDFTSYVRRKDGLAAIDLLVDGMHCGGCVSKIERALQGRQQVHQARANLTARQLHLEWTGPDEQVNDFAATVRDLGFSLSPAANTQDSDQGKRQERDLLISLAVSGFAAANVMLLSVSLWAGHDGEMAPATRDLLHWFSALIALPAIAYAGRPFFRTALTALRGGRLNMDVPISLAVLLAAGVSVWETVRGGDHVWFDSSVTLLFFLLLGRFLDRRARGRARSAATRYLALQSHTVTVLVDGKATVVRPDSLKAGAVVLVAAGERIAVDGDVIEGASDVDRSLLTGESAPEAVSQGDPVFAGTVNISGPIHVRATAVAQDTVLAEVGRLMAAAESRRGHFVTLADRVARLYAPVVHGMAAATFLGWWGIAGAPAAEALLYAIAVLIITCPCAMGLAVPAVQVVATGKLMKQGILVKSGDLLERLTQIDTIVFDKTGTLTIGAPELLNGEEIDPADFDLAAGIAASSRHPLARALARLGTGEPGAGVQEVPGFGLTCITARGEIRLGRPGWATKETAAEDSDTDEAMRLVMKIPARPAITFRFGDALRADAADIVSRLKQQGYAVMLLSGDRRPAVEAAAAATGIDNWRAELTPADKCTWLEDLAGAGHEPLMVGDGLNDAPALAAAHASLSPTTAADISQTAADAVFQGARLAPVLNVIVMARRAGRLIRQNMALSLAYNLVTIPLAVAGFVTPLVAAICMSASSLAVVINAMRLGGKG